MTITETLKEHEVAGRLAPIRTFVATGYRIWMSPDGRLNTHPATRIIKARGQAEAERQLIYNSGDECTLYRVKEVIDAR
jgi:hypothetical protein